MTPPAVYKAIVAAAVVTDRAADLLPRLKAKYSD